MSPLLRLSEAIDWLTDRFGVLAKWAVLLSCLISAGNAAFRYAFDNSSNGLLEIQWYLFAACVMLGAAQVLRVNEHVRVDVVYGRFSGKGQALIDLAGFCLFLVPVMLVMIHYSWPLFMKMFISKEMSSNAGGLIRWPAMLLLPLGFSLVLLQGVSEIIKRVAWLAHKYNGEFHYERPLQ
ncbi:TRAP transporter small permease subunit [Aquabacterium sp. OR-4]|uniref:TRAP transporter small permease subunit n=1 Tax=Aquabacterium sp. OR-4 TaxID=2978127 RepID=UPI0021B21D40|nr:TRAP transporter small permease subunit [Aquabacterium sp. OR-4]MDT7836432.1 TRAP transporter small permease subunit [Aquabacterium sp. OR-4]